MTINNDQRPPSELDDQSVAEVVALIEEILDNHDRLPAEPPHDPGE